jgi:hypothetical protein
MIRLQRSAFLLALLGVSASTVLAQSAVSAQKAPGTGTTVISGHVTLDGKPAAGLTVLLLTNDAPMTVGGSYRGRLVAKAVTDDQGSYRLDDLSAGGYKVLPFNPAFVLPGESQSVAGIGKNIFATDGESVDGIDFAIVRAAAITGRVTLADGQPAVGTWVSIRPADHGGLLFDPATAAPRQSERTDDNGVFRFFGLTPDRYKLSVSGGFGSRSNTPVYYPGVNDSSRAGIIPVAAGEEVTSADITIGASDRTYEVAGQVLDDSGKPLANASYIVYPVSDSGALVAGVNLSGRADAAGQFRLQGLLPGKRAVTVVSDGQSGYCSDPSVFNIEASNVTGLRIKAHTGAIVSGLAVIEGTDDPRVLAGISNLQLNVASFGNAPYSSRNLNLQEDGNFSMVGLMAGRLRFSLNLISGPKGFSLVRIERDGVPLKEDLIISSGEEVTGLRVVVAYATGVIRGQVSVQGGPLPDGAPIMVSARLISSESSRLMSSGLADARGRFEIQGLVDGQYEITTSYTIGGRGTPAPPRRQRITVTGGQAPGATVILDLTKTR